MFFPTPIRIGRKRIALTTKLGSVAKLLRGGETQDQPHNRPVPSTMCGISLHVEGLRWHGPRYSFNSLLTYRPIQSRSHATLLRCVIRSTFPREKN